MNRNIRLNILLIVSIAVLAASCSDAPILKTVVNNDAELSEAIKNAQPGEHIVMSNGVWKDIVIDFSCFGSTDNPITLKAETPGKVFLEGQSSLNIGGEYLVIDGLYFRNGFTPKQAVIRFRKSKEQVANNCRVTNCVILNYNQPNRSIKDHWVEFWGRHNQLDHCYLSGKSNSGPTLRVNLKGNQSILNYHKITNNHFGPRPRKGGPRGETIQIGDSYTSMCPSYVDVSDNLFEKCNGEVEVISSKSNYNVFSGNVFYQCEGSLVTRHGNYCKIDGNYFIGNETNNIGGVRLINTGHWVTNNYFIDLKGTEFRSPLAVMNGIPKSPLNRYLQVTDAVVAYNTYINCKSPWQFGIGNNIDQKDVLPKSEIRSDRPNRCIVANNLLYNAVGDSTPIVAHAELDGIQFYANVLSNNGLMISERDGIIQHDVPQDKSNDPIYVPVDPISESTYAGFDFDLIDSDILGNSRKDNNQIGAIASVSGLTSVLDKSKYGTDWFVPSEEPKPVNKIEVSSGELKDKIAQATEADILVLAPGEYNISASLIISKSVHIESRDSTNKAVIIFNGPDNQPLFMMGPRGDLTLNNVKVTGNQKNGAIASQKENMSSHYALHISNSDFSQFGYIMNGHKQSMAQKIEFVNCDFHDSQNGFQFSEEIEDKGEYNVEYLNVKSCRFNNIDHNVINYYRGGYDESTIGGNLNIENNVFSNCGPVEGSDRLINCTGIIHVDINWNTFRNNKVKYVTILWGAKDNYQSNNVIENSGAFKIVENITLKLMY
jgi:poly(beta-D-mannuronate) lyase